MYETRSVNKSESNRIAAKMFQNIEKYLFGDIIISSHIISESRYCVNSTLGGKIWI